MKKDVTYLASDKLEGRKTGSKGEKKAANYIIKQFKKNNIKAKGSNNYLQSFKKKVKLNTHSDDEGKEIEGINVVGFCDNNQNETIIIEKTN